MAKLPSSPTKEPLPDEAPLPPSFNLTQYGITVADIRRNLSPAMGITEPQATFSPCFGGPFLVWQPTKYAELLASKMREHKANAWLVNTGWSGGSYGVGSRMKLKLTRAIINAVHSGNFRTSTRFGILASALMCQLRARALIPRFSSRATPGMTKLHTMQRRNDSRASSAAILRNMPMAPARKFGRPARLADDSPRAS